MFALFSNESLKRSLIGGLGATLFGLTCLLAAAPDVANAAPVTHIPATLSQPATPPLS